jgi:hypothetical protein
MPAPTVPTSRPVPILDFLTDLQVWKMITRADPEVTLLYSQAWRSRCDDWFALTDLLMGLVGPLRVRPAGRRAISWDVDAAGRGESHQAQLSGPRLTDR